jgi:hypothetical protein
MPDMNYSRLYGKFDNNYLLSFLNTYFSNNYKDCVTIQNYINKVKYFVLNIIKGFLREPHAAHEPRYGHPCTKGH